ncbi:MAG TPA: APC family permease [Candidatus Babeliales bacterium]|nr:APC family permease [Candidatus Babeliales bacterium]
MKQHKISLFTAILLNLNIMIGSGILIGPGSMAAIAGNASYLAWIMVALIFLPIVLSTVQLSRMFPGAGGFYLYAKEGLNRTAGFASGWLYIVGYTFALVVEFMALRKTLTVMMGSNWLTDHTFAFDLLIIGSTTFLNLMSLKSLGRLLNGLTITKIIPLIAGILVLPFVFKPQTLAVSSQELALVPFAMPMAIFGYFGFEYCASISHLIEDSKKNAPRAILIGFVLTTLIYTLFNFSVINIMGVQKLSELGAPAFGDFVAWPIPAIAVLLSFLISIASVLAIFAGANGMMNGNSILLHSMAEEKLFYFSPMLSRLSKRGRPWVATVLQGLVAFFLVRHITNIDYAFSLCNLGIFTAFLLPFISLLKIQLSSEKKSMASILVTIAAIIAVLGLAIYSFYNFGSTMHERLVGMIPLFAALFAGGLLLQRKY